MAELISSDDNNKPHSIIDKCNSIDKLLNGGLAINLDANDLSSDMDMRNAIDARPSDLQFSDQ